MLVGSLFSNVDVETVDLVFRKHGIEVPSNFNFSAVNIVIGANGSGKTRLLNAIKELYTLDERLDVLYGYFPSLSDRKVSSDVSDRDLPECTLYDSMYMEDVSFSDFFKEIEAHNEEFIPELLEYHSLRQKKRGEKALNIVHDSFFALTGKELINRNKEIFVKGSDDDLEPLATVLEKLSPGELMLFYMSIFLAIQQNGKKNKVIILDEPESHLHPKALLSFVELLTHTYEFKEIWIATHSLFLVPEFQFENIVYICDSQIQSRTSNIYQKIFSSLLGDENGKTKLFLSSLSQWQYCEFIAECFTNPTVIDFVNPKDEQVQLFIEYLNTHRPFRVLDCGGGSGRLGLSLEEAQIGDSGNIIYDIYDKNPVYLGDKFGVYKDLEDIKDSYNCVVMMNFLHEVEPKDWYHLFRQIHALLEDNAYLFFVEVVTLAQGEMPNDVGYLVLGKEELEILFKNNQELLDIKFNEKQKSTCILVPRECLLNVTQGSIYNAIGHLEKRMFSEIKALREADETKKEKVDTVTARRYAFLSQQFINVKLFADIEDNRIQKQIENQKEVKKIWQREFALDKGDAESSLFKVLQYLYYLQFEFDNYVDREVVLSFQDAVSDFYIYRAISEERLTKCWKYIPLLEKAHINKELIATFLITLTLMGDSRGRNKFNNNGYIKYLSPRLSTLINALNEKSNSQLCWGE